MSANKNIILNKKIVPDNWQLVCKDEALPGVLETAGDLIVPLAFWIKEHAALAQRAGKTGVWLNGADDPAQLQLPVAMGVAAGGAGGAAGNAAGGAVNSLPLIAVEFAQFVDGRGYSIGRLLRERHGFTGELRAIGDVLRDQLLALTRCGFNSFVLKEGKSLVDALQAFDEFSGAYQNTVDQPVPYYRRRLTTVAA